jgi:hypothetical protein
LLLLVPAFFLLFILSYSDIPISLPHFARPISCG